MPLVFFASFFFVSADVICFHVLYYPNPAGTIVWPVSGQIARETIDYAVKNITFRQNFPLFSTSDSAKNRTQWLNVLLRKVSTFQHKSNLCNKKIFLANPFVDAHFNFTAGGSRTVTVEEFETLKAQKHRRNPFLNFVKKTRVSFKGAKSSQVVKDCAKKWRNLTSEEKKQFTESSGESLVFILEEHKLGSTGRRQLQHFKAAVDTYMMKMMEKYIDGQSHFEST